MPICFCEHCGRRFARRSHGMKDKLRFCSQKCANLENSVYNQQTSKGTIKVENLEGKIVQNSRFESRNELKELMELFATAPVLIVKFI